MTPSGSVNVPLGRTVATPAALGAVSPPDIVAALRRHAVGDWGDVTPDDRAANDDAFRMVKRRAAAAGRPFTTCNHTFRATGITAYLANGGTIEKAQAIAAHESPRTTKLYDRTSDEITLDEIERIRI